MKLTRPSDVRTILGELGMRPSRYLGQNFLCDENILGIILRSAGLEPGDTVLEIGPGLGVLTEPMLEAAYRVIAIEKDAALCSYLRSRFIDARNFELLEGDALDYDLESLLKRGISKIVANLPYSVGSRLLVEVTEFAARPETMILMLQLDVARRLCAKPGTRDYGLLTIRIQLDYEIELTKTVNRTCFHTPPDVRSAILTFRRREEPVAQVSDRDFMYLLLKLCFSRRRKQVGHILRSMSNDLCIRPADIQSALDAESISPEKRPEDISISSWAGLANRLSPHNRHSEKGEWETRQNRM